MALYVRAMTPDTTVIYNASCPICSREIELYRRYSTARGLSLRFDDLNTVELAQWNLTPEDAARRLHVIEDGKLLSGTDAFLTMWARMPRYRPLARIVGLPGIRHIAALVYEAALAPALYALHRRRVRRLECKGPL